MADAKTIPAARHRLAVRSLGVRRGDSTLFAALDFELAAGEVLFLKGANGSGKTSLLYILAGLRNPDEGEVSWNDKPVNKLGKEYHEQLCFVGHQSGIKAELTVSENLLGFRILRDATVCKQDDQAIIDQLDLYGYEDTFCYQLSSGQQRRLGLARLIGNDRPLWILDEPFTALDRKSVTFFEQQIAEHVAAGGLVVITSHQSLRLDGCHVKEINLDEAVR